MSEEEFAAFEAAERARSGARGDDAVGRAGPRPPQHLEPRRKIYSYSETWVRRHCLPQPRPIGCTIQRNIDAMRTSWTARYPGCFPASHTKSHDGAAGITCKAACHTVLAWLWQQLRVKHPDVVCEWDLGMDGDT